MKVLCVAEKPSVARSLAEILLEHVNGASRRMLQSSSPYHPVHEIHCPHLPPYRQPVTLVITAVSGHVYSAQFSQDRVKSWATYDIENLFSDPVEQQLPQNNRLIEENLQKHAAGCQELWLWLDCDREGEAIADEVRSIVTNTFRSIVVRRAKFTALTQEQIFNAIRTLGPIDEAAVKAVKVRSELDLRFGAIFTRFQTLLIDNRALIRNGNGILSYGNCQFPTLKLIVQRYLVCSTCCVELY
jgi:DNA topoisomerase-3